MANEKRLIMTEQDAIVAAEQELSVCRYIAECTKNPGMIAIHRKRCEWLSVVIRLAKKAIKGNAVEVVHGRWIEEREIPSYSNKNIPVVECSKCRCLFCDIINVHSFMYHYCPNCGAKMDGDGNG